MPLSPLDFGGIDNPNADNRAAVQQCLMAAVDRGEPVADPRPWGVAGGLDVDCPDQLLRIGDLSLKQLAPDAPDRRTLMVRGGVRLETERLVIDRGKDGSCGQINNASALWVMDGSGHRLRNIEVFGGSKGQAISVINTEDVEIVSPHLHDMFFDEPGADNDRLQGIWLENVRYPSIVNPSIYRLGGNVPGKPWWRSRAIAVGQTWHLSILNVNIHHVDQGVDITGQRNWFTTLQGGNIDETASWAVKCANSALYAKIADVTASNNGLSAFVASGPSGPGYPGTTGVEFADCTSINPGGDPRGLAVGFLNLDSFMPGYPRRTVLRNCRALDLREQKIMTHGAFNRVPGQAKIEGGFESRGHTDRPHHGFN
jgi:hypothetical protein